MVSCVRPFDDEGVMCSNPNFRGITEVENRATGRAWTPFELLLQAFETGAAPVAPSSHVEDHGSLGQWPGAPFVQPLRQGEDE